MYFPVSGWFAAFVLTLAVETPIVAFLLRRAEPDLLRHDVLIVFANLATHLVVWYVISQLLLVGTLGYTLVAETWERRPSSTGPPSAACRRAGRSPSRSPRTLLHGSPVG